MYSSLFFGASVGRSGTMYLANLLNSEKGVLCVHEGKIRTGEVSGQQYLPFLTLENRIGYEYPERKVEIIEQKRPIEVIKPLVREYSHFGDVAYNNSPFIGELANQFPESKFLISIRDGREFVRSATVLKGEDTTPVGWAENSKPLTPLERYIALGRLQPRQNSPVINKWENWNAFQKNCWLWSETNKLIFDGISLLEEDRYQIVRLEDLKNSPLETYSNIRDFLGIKCDLTRAGEGLLRTKSVNKKNNYDIPEYREWTDEMKSFFHDQAGQMMEKLSYGK